MMGSTGRFPIEGLGVKLSRASRELCLGQYQASDYVAFQEAYYSVDLAASRHYRDRRDLAQIIEAQANGASVQRMIDLCARGVVE
nr:hypothetical protein [Paracoccus beibuensis]